jgi:hypothetical protein
MVPGTVEMYLPAPKGSSREEAYRQHVSNRNFLAWVVGMPLVGAYLSQTMVDLFERMQHFRNDEADNMEDFIRYAEDAGYLDFPHNPDFALAILHFSERYELDDLWADAFTHCVGMSAQLATSNELEVRTTLHS